MTIELEAIRSDIGDLKSHILQRLEKLAGEAIEAYTARDQSAARAVAAEKVVEILQEDLKSRTATIERLREQSSQDQAHIRSQAISIEALNVTLSVLKGEIAASADKLAKAQAESVFKRGDQSKLDIAEATIIRLQNEDASVKVWMKQIKDQLKQVFDAVGLSECTSLDFNRLLPRVFELAQAEETLKTEVTELKRQLEVANSETRSRDAIIASSRDDITALQRQLSELRAENSSLRSGSAPTGDSPEAGASEDAKAVAKAKRIMADINAAWRDNTQRVLCPLQDSEFDDVASVNYKEAFRVDFDSIMEKRLKTEAERGL